MGLKPSFKEIACRRRFGVAYENARSVQKQLMKILAADAVIDTKRFLVSSLQLKQAKCV